MEIIKLNSDTEEDALSERDSGDATSRTVITKLKQGVKNPNRVNVFLNGKYSFSLGVAQVVELGVKVGRELSPEELSELKSASEYGKLYQRTLEWVLVRPRSVRETRDYLARKFRKSSSDALVSARRHGQDFARPLPVSRGWSPEDSSELSDKVVSRLLDKGYLDDQRFAEWYVENRFVKKGVSRKRLKMELVKKGIEAEIIDAVLDGRDDEKEIQKMIEKKRGKYDDEKLMAYLCRQGFSYDLVQKVLNGD